MPKNNKYPVPKKRYHGGCWRIYWKWNAGCYDFFVFRAFALLDACVGHGQPNRKAQEKLVNNPYQIRRR